MPVSPALTEILLAGADLSDALGQVWVSPLHLMAAILDPKQTSPGTRIVRLAGVTQEQVIAKLREG